MDRHQDWSVIVCLIGGGQEINTGEAGLSEWIDALKNHFSSWNVFYSSKIDSDENYLDQTELKNWLSEKAFAEDNLHLSVSVRSFRSEKVSELMQKLLGCVDISSEPNQ